MVVIPVQIIMMKLNILTKKKSKTGRRVPTWVPLLTILCKDYYLNFNTEVVGMAKSLGQ